MRCLDQWQFKTDQSGAGSKTWNFPINFPNLTLGFSNSVWNSAEEGGHDVDELCTIISITKTSIAGYTWNTLFNYRGPATYLQITYITIGY